MGMSTMKTSFKKKPAFPARTAQPGSPFHLATVLELRLPHLRKRPKRLRTRAQILCATAKVMEQVGYEGLTVDLITEAAGIARGTFYLHFKDRSQAAMAVVRTYSALILRARPRGSRGLGTREAIYRMNTYYIRVYALNAQLLSGRESLLRARPELVAKRDQGNFEWAQSVVRDVRTRIPRKWKVFESPTFYLKVRAVIAMADEMLRQVYLYRVEGLAHYAEREDLLIQVLSDIWYETLYAPYEMRA